MRDDVYTYTYFQPDEIHPHTTEVRIFERGEHDGFVIYLLEPLGEWPHRLGEKALLRAVTLFPDEEAQWIHHYLVAQDGNGNS